MIRHACNMLMVLLVVAVAACTSAAPKTATPVPRIEGMIYPGDKIGDFLITTGDAENVTFMWDQGCTGPDENATCLGTVGKNLNLSYGIYAPRGMDLEKIWAEHTYKMFINDTPVNLEAFGTINTFHPQVGKMRLWNVMIVPTKPGQLVVRHSTVVHGEPSGGTNTYVFSNP